MIVASRAAPDIHPTAVVAPGARVGAGTTIGPYAVLGPEVTLGEDCRIGTHAVIEGHTTIGHRNQIFTGAILGNIPQDMKYQGEPSHLVVGDDNRFREYVTVNTGTGEVATTRIGNHTLVMAYAHVAHDCTIGDHAIIANSGTLAGHVVVEDWAILGGLCGVHQFVRLGAHAIVGGASKVTKDVLPYSRVDGHPCRCYGPNTIGLQRHGFTADQIRLLKRAFRTLSHQDLNTSQAVARLQPLATESAEVRDLVDFIENRATRGIIK